MDMSQWKTCLLSRYHTSGVLGDTCNVRNLCTRRSPHNDYTLDSELSPIHANTYLAKTSTVPLGQSSTGLCQKLSPLYDRTWVVPSCPQSSCQGKFDLYITLNTMFHYKTTCWLTKCGLKSKSVLIAWQIQNSCWRQEKK